MTDYKYKLEKYAGRTTRHECPNCKTKLSFARYVDEQGNYIADNVGRCNREDKCGYHLTPSEYFKNKGMDYVPIINVAPKPLPPTDYIPEETMIRTLNTENNFIQFLTKYFSLIDVANTINKYRIGDAKDGKVIYWQIDQEDRIRTGKIMLYNSEARKESLSTETMFVRTSLDKVFNCTYWSRRKRKKCHYSESHDPRIYMGSNRW